MFRPEVHEGHRPGCGMKIDSARAAATREFDGKTFYFCATGCASAFDADPQRYVHSQSTH